MTTIDELEKEIREEFERRGKAPRHSSAPRTLAIVGVAIWDRRDEGELPVGFTDGNWLLPLFVDKLVLYYLDGERTAPPENRAVWTRIRPLVEANVEWALEHRQKADRSVDAATIDTLTSLCLGRWPNDGFRAELSRICGVIPELYAEACP